VRHRGDAPARDADGETARETDAVEEGADAEEGERGGELEGGGEMSVIAVGPVELGCSVGLSSASIWRST